VPPLLHEVLHSKKVFRYSWCQGTTPNVGDCVHSSSRQTGSLSAKLWRCSQETRLQGVSLVGMAKIVGIHRTRPYSGNASLSYLEYVVYGFGRLQACNKVLDPFLNKIGQNQMHTYTPYTTAHEVPAQNAVHGSTVYKYIFGQPGASPFPCKYI